MGSDYRLQNVQNHAAKVVFRRADMSMLDHCSRHFTGCQSKTGLFLRQPLFFMVPSHHVSLHTFLAHSVPVQMKKLLLVQDGNLKALVTGRSLFRLPLSGTTFLLTSDTAVLSHSSKLLLKHLSLLLPTLGYSNPFTGKLLQIVCLFPNK